MTKEQKRLAAIQAAVKAEFQDDWFDVDMLSSFLDSSDLNVVPEEAFAICALNLGTECLRTFTYHSKMFYNNKQAQTLLAVDELRNNL